MIPLGSKNSGRTSLVDVARRLLQQAGYRAQNKDRLLAYARSYREANRASIRAKDAVLRDVNREARTASDRDSRVRNRGLVFDHYGRVCQCGCSNPQYLTIDHVHGGGKAHRDQIGGSSTSLYKWLVRNNFPIGFRTLCFNCQILEHRKVSPITNMERQRLRSRVFAILGNCLCGVSDPVLLTIGHKLGDGALHRKSIGGGRSLPQAVLRDLRDKGPEFVHSYYEAQCFNCNCGSNK